VRLGERQHGSGFPALHLRVVCLGKFFDEDINIVSGLKEGLVVFYKDSWSRFACTHPQADGCAWVSGSTGSGFPALHPGLEQMSCCLSVKTPHLSVKTPHLSDETLG